MNSSFVSFRAAICSHVDKVDKLCASPLCSGSDFEPIGPNSSNL